MKSALVQRGAIADASKDAIMGNDLNGMITSWNRGAERIFGYTAEEIVGTSIMRLIPAARSSEEDHILLRVQRGESVEHLETVRVAKGGRLIDVLVTVSPITDAAGRVTGVAKVAHDITQRKQAEKQFKASAKEIDDLTVALDQHAIVAITDPQGKITYANDMFCALSKYSREELIGQDHRLISSGHHPKEFIRDLWTTITSGRQWQGEIKNRAKDGSFYWVDTTIVPFLDEQGKPRQHVAIRIDITARKRTEQALYDSEARFRFLNEQLEQRVIERTAALRASEARYHLLFDSMDEGFCIIEMIFDERENPVDYRFLEINPAFERHTGLHDATGKTMRELAPQHEANWFEAYSRVAMTGESTRFQSQAKELGRCHDVYACRFGESKNRQVAIVFADITERKAAEANIGQLNVELQRHATELEAANKELEAFSYSVSHDLRAPLRAINGFAGIVIKQFGPQMPAAAHPYLERICNAGKQMGLLIDSLLAFSRLSRQPLNGQQVDTGNLVQNVLHDLSPQHEHRRIEFQTAPLPDCWGDPALLRQVWINLLSNAIKYTRGRESARIEIGCVADAGEDVYFVRDNGAGFDMQYAHKLFGVFQRLHLAEKFEGTGVGLAIVHRIVSRHAGRVWAEAEEDRGATFRFTLGTEK